MSYLTPSLSPIHSIADLAELAEVDMSVISEADGERFSFYVKTLSTPQLQVELKTMREEALKIAYQIETIEEELEIRAMPLEERLKLLSYPELEAILDEKLELRKTLEGNAKDATEDWIIAAFVEVRRRRQ
jgi:hypothetical protein